MVREFSAISELKSIREQKSRLSEREQELIKPILSDLNIIPVIYRQVYHESLLQSYHQPMYWGNKETE